MSLAHTITQWPAEERPREKLLARGAAALSDAELLAIFLRTGVKGKTAVDMARELIQEFGSLRALFDASETRFCQTHGLGMAKYTQLQAVLEMARRHTVESLIRGDALTSPQLTRRYLTSELRHFSHEVFACLFLDNQNRVIVFEKLFHGTLDSANVYPREVLKRALHHHAAAVIFAHNHPSGLAEPSQADQSITHRLKQALDFIDIRVLDHFIVGDGPLYSFAEHGLI